MQSCAVFDTKAMQQEEGRTAFGLAVFVVLLLIVLCVLFQKDAHKLVIPRQPQLRLFTPSAGPDAVRASDSNHRAHVRCTTFVDMT
jgi:hypothetical protein